MISRFSVHRPRRASVAVLGIALVVMALGPASAGADHGSGSTLQCEAQNRATQTFDCILTVNFNQPVLSRGTVLIDIRASPMNATFADPPSRTGGTCPPDAQIRQLSPTSAAIGPPLPTPSTEPFPCTYVLAETLRAEGFGEVCQELAWPILPPYFRVCAQLRPPPLPATREQCKDGGWQQYGVFKNQGDCVSFVASQGKNQPGGRG